MTSGWLVDIRESSSEGNVTHQVGDLQVLSDGTRVMTSHPGSPIDLAGKSQ